MNIKNLNEFIANNTIALDKSIPPTIDYDEETVTFHVSMLNEKMDIEQWFKDNEVFTVKQTDELVDALDDDDFNTFIAFHYGPDDLDIYSISIKDITFHYGRIIIYKTGKAILEKRIRPTTEDCRKNAPAPSTEGEKWDSIMKNIDTFLKKVDTRIGVIEEKVGKLTAIMDNPPCEVDELADEDFEDDSDEDVDEDEGEGEENAEEEAPKTDTYTYSLEGKLGTDGVFHVKETTSDGKVIEKSVQLDTKDGTDEIIKKLAGLAEDIRKAGGGINLNDMIP